MPPTDDAVTAARPDAAAAAVDAAAPEDASEDFDFEEGDDDRRDDRRSYYGGYEGYGGYGDYGDPHQKEGKVLRKYERFDCMQRQSVAKFLMRFEAVEREMRANGFAEYSEAAPQMAKEQDPVANSHDPGRTGRGDRSPAQEAATSPVEIGSGPTDPDPDHKYKDGSCGPRRLARHGSRSTRTASWRCTTTTLARRRTSTGRTS